MRFIRVTSLVFRILFAIFVVMLYSEENIEVFNCGSHLPAALYLLPSAMGEGALSEVLPPENLRVMALIRHFVVENVREARRFIRRALPDAEISNLEFHELNRHTDLSDPAEIRRWLAPISEGCAVGLMSDAGCPGVADPGAVVVREAHRLGYRVRPLVGPSSILLGLMASGFNGQGFCFHGYLPVDEEAREGALRRLERLSALEDMTQICIETPYRNRKLLEAMSATLRPDTMICVARDITDPERELIVAKTAEQWRKALNGGDMPALDKHPAVFLLYAAGEQKADDTRGGRKNAYRRPSDGGRNERYSKKKRERRE